MANTTEKPSHYPTSVTMTTAKWRCEIKCACGAKIVRHDNEKERAEYLALSAMKSHCVVPSIEVN